MKSLTGVTLLVMLKYSIIISGGNVLWKLGKRKGT